MRALVAAAAIAAGTGPTCGGSHHAATCPGGLAATFIQIGPRELDHDARAWRRDLALIRRVGARQVVLQYSGDQHGPFDGRPGERAPVRALLEAAGDLDVSVILGLHFDPRWPGEFPEGALPPPLDRPAEIEALVALCAGSPACAGWYLPEEIDDRTAATADGARRARRLLEDASSALRRLDPGRPIAIAPYYTGELDPQAHARLWGELLEGRPVDIVYLQDGVGSGHGSAEAARQRLVALLPVTRALGVELWSTVELFTQIHGPPRDELPFQAAPAKFTVLRHSLEVEGEAGVPLAAFTVLDYMHPARGLAAARLHADYLAWCAARRVVP